MYPKSAITSIVYFCDAFGSQHFKCQAYSTMNCHPFRHNEKGNILCDFKCRGKETSSVQPQKHK